MGRTAAPHPYPVDLRPLTRHPMLVGMRGVLVRQVSSSPGGIFQVSWLRADVPSLIPPGRIMLVWESMEGAARRVTARLGLPGGQVLLAVWPSLIRQL
jgi:hypothetical protein